MGMSDILEALAEGLGAKQFGYDWRQKLAAEELANQRAKQVYEQSDLMAPILREQKQQATEESEARAGGYLSREEKIRMAREKEANQYIIAQAKIAAAKELDPEKKAVMEARVKALESQARLNDIRGMHVGEAQAAGVVKEGMDPETGIMGFYRIRPNNAVEQIQGLASKPTAQLQNREYQAKVIQSSTDALYQMLDDPQYQAVIGPATGRKNKGLDIVGIAPWQAREMRAALKSYAALLAIIHGYRGGHQTQEDFERMIGDIEQGPAQLKASIKAVTDLAMRVEYMPPGRSHRLKAPGGGGLPSADEIRQFLEPGGTGGIH